MKRWHHKPIAGEKPAVEQSHVAGGPLEQRGSRSGTCSSRIHSFQGKSGVSNMDRNSTCKFQFYNSYICPLEGLGKHPCQKGNSPMQLIFSVLLHPTLHYNHVHSTSTAYLIHLKLETLFYITISCCGNEPGIPEN